ncbi:MAG: hypothetical protein KDN19_03730 [Verrucomicrobiae bacterium]|nr:hypothetical protein [Verrucomicrobiae bacterium]
MNTLARFVVVAALICAFPLGLQAAPEGWSVSVGVQARQVDVGFQIDAPSPVNARSLFSPRSSRGPGDVGVATSGTDFISYSDGTVGTNLDTAHDFDTSFTVNSASQVVFGSQPPGEDFATPGTVIFHSSGTTYEYDEHVATNPFSVDDNEVVVSPYIELRRTLCEQDGVFFDLAVSWTYLESEHGTGTPRNVLTQSVMESVTSERYTYIYDLPSSSGGAPSGFPPVYSNAGSNGVIYNADGYNAFGGFGPGDPHYVQNPRTYGSQRTSDRLVALLEAESSARLDVDAHVIPIILDARCEVKPGIMLGIGAGPTLNVISHDLHSQTDWYLNGSHIGSDRDSNSGTDFVVGATVRALLSVALSDDGTFCFEASGGYDWVPSQTVSAGPTQAEIDLSSWMGSIGFCKWF